MERPRLLEEWIDGTMICRESSAVGFAWSFYECCLHFFAKLVPLVSKAVPTAPAKVVLSEEVGRLLSWGDGFENGELDRTLERDPELKSTALEYLSGLGTALVDKLFVTPMLNEIEGGAELESKAFQLRSMVNNAKTIIEDSEDDGSDTESYIGIIKDSREMLDEIASDIRFYNLRLMDLLPSIERTALQPKDLQDSEKAPRSTPSAQFQVSEPAYAYVLQVRDKFPEAERKLVERLGEANWQRRIRIRRDPHDLVHSVVVDISKSVFIPVSLFHDSGLGTSIPTQSAYAPTVVSHSSFRTSATESQAGSYKVPPTPKEVATGDPFTCEICGHMLKNIKNRVDWKIHVFADLKPYICTFSSCSDELCAFPTRTLWADHEFRKHRTEKFWHCYLCSDELSSPSTWESHISKAHRTVLSSDQRRKVLDMAECFKAMPTESQVCPMCLKRGMKTQKEFTTHVAKHMENIALAALPREADSDSGSDYKGGSVTTTDDGETSSPELSSPPRTLSDGSPELSSPPHTLSDGSPDLSYPPHTPSEPGSPELYSPPLTLSDPRSPELYSPPHTPSDSGSPELYSLPHTLSDPGSPELSSPPHTLLELWSPSAQQVTTEHHINLPDLEN